ncbi:hypothetical protein GCM10028857_10150 [Salinarchaeum chitinilyticum]
MLTVDKFEEKYPPETLEAELPDEPITSLRDIQYLYGRLYTLATTGSGQYAAYLTPDAAGDLIDESESLIVVRIDASGDEPRIDSETPVLFTRYVDELVESVAHCKYDAARGIDHSVTHQSGADSDPEKLARYAKERLTKWATDDVVQEAAENHEDGWIVDALATLGEDDDVLERIDESAQRSLGGSTTALLTVQVKTDPGGDYQWPGELDVFNEAMRQRKLSKLVSKNDAEESAGQAVDLIDGSESRTVGTAEDPLNYFLGKQLESFPGFDADEAWRSHPISEDNAVTVMNAGTFVHACTYRSFGATVYYLPYFVGDLSPEDAYWLYSSLYEIVNAGGDETPLKELYDDLSPNGIEEYPEKLRFYVAAVQKHQMSRYDVFGDTLNGSLLYPWELSKAHNAVLSSWAYDAFDESDDRWNAPVPSHENWPLLHAEGSFEAIASGLYFYVTLPEGDDDQNASADDVRIDAHVSVLAGDSIPVETLLPAYVDRLLDAESGDDSFPTFVVASQFAQLQALAVSNLLTTNDREAYSSIADADGYENLLTMESQQTAARTDGGIARAELRDQKLEKFLDETDALQDNAERRGAFLLGVLIGQIGGYQQGSEGRSTTVVDQYSIKSMTQSKVKRVTGEVLDRDVVYSRDNGMSSTMYAEVVDRLNETLAKRDPDDWNLSTADLRFYYALGVSYGLNNWIEPEDDEAVDTEEAA